MEAELKKRAEELRGTAPAPADRPELREAQVALFRLRCRAQRAEDGLYYGDLGASEEDAAIIRLYLSQPEPAVPPMSEDDEQTVNQLVQEAREKEEPFAIQPSESPAVPDGYVLVPKEPTERMRDAFADTYHRNDRTYHDGVMDLVDAYRAMIAAAPTPDEGES